MNLKQFVAVTIQEVVEGAAFARSQTGAAVPRQTSGKPDQPIPGMIVSYNCDILQIIEFDLAVTVTEGSNQTSEIGVASSSIANESTRTNSSISRVKFSIPVKL